MFSKLCLIGLSILISGCISLLVPNVTTEVVNLRAGEYKLDQTHAAIIFKVQHIGLSTYVGRFNKFDASLDFDPDNISATELNGIIEITSLDINNSALAEDLMSRTWFDAEKFPQAVFSTREVQVVGGNEFDFVGNLDWRGVIKPVTLRVTFNGGATNILTGKYTLGFAAKGSILRSNFGMDAYIPIVGDKIDIEIYAEFQKS